MARALNVATWKVGPPQLVIDGTGNLERAPLGTVRGAVRLRDGVVVVADNETTTLRFFDLRGRETRSAGGKGAGPGEAAFLEGLFAVHDTLYALDGRDGVLVFSNAGRFVRRVRWGGGERGQVFHERPLGVAAGSRLLGTWRTRTLLQATSGQPIESELRLSNGSRSGFTALGRYIVSRTFKRRADRFPRLLGFSPGLTAVAFPSEICYSTREQFIVRCVDTLGVQTRLIERATIERRVTTDMAAALRTGMSGRRPDGTSMYEGSLRAHRELMARTVELAPVLPAIGRLVAASTGDLWVSEFSVPADALGWSQGGEVPHTPTRWAVFGPDGQSRAQITLPPRFHLFDAGAGWLLGVQTQDDETQRIVLLALVMQ
jgi:hypothetical protein